MKARKVIFFFFSLIMVALLATLPILFYKLSVKEKQTLMTMFWPSLKAGGLGALAMMVILTPIFWLESLWENRRPRCPTCNHPLPREHK